MGISQSFATARDYPSRSLGYGEQLWLKFSELTSNNFVMVAQLDGSMDVQRLCSAMERVVLTFPILRARVSTNANAPQLIFSRVPRVPLSIVPGSADTDWARLAERELNNRIPFDADLLWRATLLQDARKTVLILTFNHAVSDGHSAYVIIRELLQCYVDPSAAGSAMPPPAAYDDLLPPGQTWRMLTRCMPEFITTVLRPGSPALGAPRNVFAQADASVSSRFIELSLDPHTSAGVVRRCKHEGVGMHALLSSALLQATHCALGGEGTKEIVLSAAVNVRPRLQQVSPRDVGYFATGIEGRYSLTGNDDIWRLAERVAEDVNAQFTTERIAFSLQLRRLILAWKKDPQALVDALAKRSRASIHLTNLGRPALPQHYGDLNLRACFPIPSVHFLNKPVLCLASVFYADRLRLVFSYVDPLTDPGFVDCVMSQLRLRLCEIAE
ncbi:condensation domain-containing protein [Allohahella marinimesophila]|uniref:Condensation domain-containing protein n=1 Tax=Allohahella marinimesophila TaxID=1054972 RepID=A0ABP7NYX7_9GAMM